MSERMTPIPVKELIAWLKAEHAREGAAFGVPVPYIHAEEKTLPLFSERLEVPLGPAAGPNTQLAENMIAAYFAGARFFELKTVQKMDGEELAKCISRPCILANDEGYNCEWSTELTVPEAFFEYVKAWTILKVISKKWGLGDPSGFMFNMSVGYDLAGIKTEKLDRFIMGMRDASSTPEWAECIKALKEAFPEDAAYIDEISPKICTGVTVSTLHGCPPEEIEAIASYLISEKKLNTFVKCNPTILGYSFARERLNRMGYSYIAFDEHHFNEDLQFSDAIPMFRRLKALAETNGLEFGLKLSNTFPVDVKANELPSEEMYMSGKSLYPLTIEMARRISREFAGELRLSYSGGADIFNIKPLFEAGIWPITVATTILKPGGYARLTGLARELASSEYKPFTKVDVDRVAALSLAAESEPRHMKAVKPLPSRKIKEKVPLFDCFIAPCTKGCPIEQDIPEYTKLVAEKRYLEALTLICEKNALPNITGTICAHRCMDKCTRNFYDDSVNIRKTKLEAVNAAYDEYYASLEAPKRRDVKPTAIVGAGPAGIAAAYFLAREGYPVTVFEREEKAGGVVRNVIPEFRIPSEAIERDVALAKKLGAEFKLGCEAPDLAALREAGYDKILLAFGASKRGALNIEGDTVNVIDFLKTAKSAPEKLSLGAHVAVVGGGNSAMDAARMALRLGAEVSIVYRRTKEFMPADSEELELAISEGVKFIELASPVKHEGNVLVCREMELGERGADGRRTPKETDRLIEVLADTVIAAVGEKPCPNAFARYGVTLEGLAPFDCGNGVYAAGDAYRGPATIVEAIADARRFADTVTGGRRKSAKPASAKRNYRDTLLMKGELLPEREHDGARCLGCSTVCENCATVCPNRANVAITVPGYAMRQILHIDRLCNECGNCAVFCPYDSKPYRDKFTLFANERDFLDSANEGFYVKDKSVPTVVARLEGKTGEYDLSKRECGLCGKAEDVVYTVVRDYGYLI